MTSFEEAKRCPICGMPGDDRSQSQGKDSHGRPCTVHQVYCVTKLCRWYETAWLVQINEDGSIPEAYKSAGEQKLYPKVSPETESKINEMLERQLQAETKPGSELRNPYS